MEEQYITMVMPTFNHSTYIDYFLNNAVDTYNGNLFKFEIHDSSENDDTKDLIEKFNNIHKTKVKYFRYESTLNGDLKTYKALSQCPTDFLYLMGDGVCPDFNKLEEYLLEKKFNEYDLFGIFMPGWTERFKKENFKLDTIYDNYEIDKFFSLFFHEFTYYGGSIISKNLWEYVKDNSIFKNYEFNGRYSYAYDSSLFTALAKNNSFKYCASFISFYRGNPLKKASVWSHGETLYTIGIQEFENDVTKLPDIYNPYKQYMFKKSRKVGFNFHAVLFYKLNNSIKFKYLKKYKKDLKHVKSNYYMMLCICFVPKWCINLGRKTKHLLKKILGRA